MPADLKAAAWPLLSLLLLAAVWTTLAAILDTNTLPGPVAVWHAFLREWRLGYMADMAATLARVAAAFLAAMLIGSAIGIWLGTTPRADRLFWSWVIFFLNVPALVTIVLCYVWFGLTETAAILAVALNKIPNVASTLREGARSLSTDLTEMAQLYRLSPLARLRHVILPQLAPFFAAAARNGLALVWKIVLVVELLGRPNGVGFEIHTQFQLFDVAGIFAYALGFIAIVQAIEWLILAPWERATRRWRR
ncbi:Putative aliphatic sulfonates transport permease protein SsuC [Marinibacterium anthonyi]|nr:Putative aliphatic sulfonates transport permease protein SsuC [Marinibacterium anthonyi]